MYNYKCYDITLVILNNTYQMKYKYFSNTKQSKNFIYGNHVFNFFSPRYYFSFDDIDVTARQTSLGRSPEISLDLQYFINTATVLTSDNVYMWWETEKLSFFSKLHNCLARSLSKTQGAGRSERKFWQFMFNVLEK